LELAVKLLPKRFQKDHAKFKYGDENAMSMDRPSLRRFCETIYWTTIMEMHEENQSRMHMGIPDTGEHYNFIPHEYDKGHKYDKEVIRLAETIDRYFEAGIELFFDHEKTKNDSSTRHPKSNAVSLDKPPEVVPKTTSRRVNQC